MQEKFPTQVYSEIGELEGVIIHSPGPEVENMTPQNAERALYSDILNLSVASREFNQLKGVLEKVTRTFEVKDLLADILKNEKVKESLINKICKNELAECIKPYLISLSEKQLAIQLIEGVQMQKKTLTSFLSKERYSLPPLHNFFYTRDAAISIYDNVFIGKMKSPVRLRESLIMEAIFDFHPSFSTKTLNPATISDEPSNISIEGGDVLVARHDIVMVGIGPRTTPEGVDFILQQLKEKNEHQHIIVQELPYSPESFIHLDMVFTMIDMDKCILYDPVVMKMNKYQTVHIYAAGGEVKIIREEENLPTALRNLGMDMKPIFCGGSSDPWFQEREQWHSGANFFAIGPGKIIGYARNSKTLEELNKNGMEIIKASDVIKGKVNLNDYDKYVITIEGSELPRGGGGARCMTMPIRRKHVHW
ncbi:MAG: arginine deiminase [Bacteroidetes bacterium]|nr:MAG: arginine deiminase [Bacteroidota bacterium]